MDKEKEIEYLAQKLFENYKANYHIFGECYSRKCEKDNIPHCGNFQQVAEAVIDADYGNVKQYQNEIERLQIELAHREEDLVHADEKVFYREMAVRLDEDKIKDQAVKEFAEKLKNEIKEMKMEETSAYNEVYNEALEDINNLIKKLIMELKNE